MRIAELVGRAEASVGRREMSLILKTIGRLTPVQRFEHRLSDPNLISSDASPICDIVSSEGAGGTKDFWPLVKSPFIGMSCLSAH